jgi:hypothetical protein
MEMYLDLSGCSILLEGLPVSFNKLTKLVHLDMSDCSHLTGVSLSLESLTNLEYLNLSGCMRIRKLPKHLGSLLQLPNFNLSNSSYAFGCINIQRFAALTKLERLDMAALTSISSIKIYLKLLAGSPILSI